MPDLLHGAGGLPGPGRWRSRQKPGGAPYALLVGVSHGVLGGAGAMSVSVRVVVRRAGGPGVGNPPSSMKSAGSMFVSRTHDGGGVPLPLLLMPTLLGGGGGGGSCSMRAL